MTPSRAPRDPGGIDLERAYEYAGGDSWDDLLQYFDSDPTEDFPGVSKRQIAVFTERLHALFESGEPYPDSPDALRELLAQRN